MKKTLLNVLVGLALVAPAMAGTDAAPASAAPAPSVDLFRAHEWNVDLYGAYAVRTQDGSGSRDGWGGGASVGHFFTRVVGLRFDLSSEGHVGLVGGNLVLRAPIDAARIAPYAIFGIGTAVFSNVDDYYLRAGGGLEARFTQNVGVFTEATYNWVDHGPDRVVLKAGVRFAF